MRGSVLILSMIGIGCLAASFAVWYSHRQTRGVLSTLGPETTLLITSAENVDFVQLARVGNGTDDAGNDLLPIEPSRPILLRRNIIDAGGITHLRHALCQNVSFTWNGSKPKGMVFQYALIFFEEDRSATLLFDVDKKWMLAWESEAGMKLSDKFASGLQVYFGELIRSATIDPSSAPSVSELSE